MLDVEPENIHWKICIGNGKSKEVDFMGFTSENMVIYRFHLWQSKNPVPLILDTPHDWAPKIKSNPMLQPLFI
jgi:hypothetical protein